MKIALLGYGKMGRLIEQLALNRGHEIVLRIDSKQLIHLNSANLKQADVAIEFSTPYAVLNHIEACFEADLPVVVGTTGWYDRLSEIRQTCNHQKQTLIYGSNFSIGVNLFFYVNKVLAKLIDRYLQYDVQIEEIHHVHKLDSPSGTAITLAEGIIGQMSRKKEWVNELIGNSTGMVHQPTQLLIESHRMEEAPGTHTVIYSSEIDDIELKHTAHSRNGFALGAVLAAEWLQGKSGFFSVDDLFDFKI